VDGTRSRLQIDTAFTNFFRTVMALAPADLEAAAFLACGGRGGAGDAWERAGWSGRMPPPTAVVAKDVSGQVAALIG
jgi:hypothetical protein